MSARQTRVMGTSPDIAATGNAMRQIMFALFAQAVQCSKCRIDSAGYVCMPFKLDDEARDSSFHHELLMCLSPFSSLDPSLSLQHILSPKSPSITTTSHVTN